MTETTANTCSGLGGGGGGGGGGIPLKWIFRGTIAVPTGNPFSRKIEEEAPAAAEAGPANTAAKDRSDDDDDTPRRSRSTSSSLHNKSTAAAVVASSDKDVEWLGPGLKLLHDHVLAVDGNGRIVCLTAEKDYHLSRVYYQHQEQETAANNDSGSNMIVQIIALRKHEFLCPGMIDLHIHAPQYAFAGTATDRPLMGPEGWLETYTFPAERSLEDDLPERARRVYEGVVNATLRTGTTTAVYFATLHLEPCKILVDTAMSYGQRALIGKVCMDRNAPDDYCQTLERNIEESRSLIEYIHSAAGREQNYYSDEKSSMANEALLPLPLVLPMVVPRFIPTCTPELLSALGEQAARYRCHITSHIAESIDEVRYSRSLDARDNDLGDGSVGRTDARIFDAHGLLTDRTIMAHGVHLTTDGDEWDLLRDRGTAIAHCPLSNFFFAGGSLPCRRLLERGDNKVGLGTDVAGGYHPSMLHASRTAVLASHALQHQEEQRQNNKNNGNDNSSAAEHSADNIGNDGASEIGGSSESGATKRQPRRHTIDYRHAFYLATLGGAEALGLQGRIGTFAVGMEFDAFVLSAAAGVYSPVVTFESDTVADVFQKLLVLGDDRNVTRVFVQGREVTQKRGAKT